MILLEFKQFLRQLLRPNIYSLLFRGIIEYKYYLKLYSNFKKDFSSNNKIHHLKKN